jgi:hypothetical protein
MFGMLGIFSDFEREMIVARVNVGLARAKDAIARDGHFTSKAGKKRKRLGRPNADPKKVEAARRELANGIDILRGFERTEAEGDSRMSQRILIGVLSAATIAALSVADAVASLSSVWVIQDNTRPPEAPRVVAQTDKTQVIEAQRFENNRVPASVRQLLSKSERLELLSLDPHHWEGEGPRFHRYRILGSTTLTGDAANRLVSALEESASEPMFGPANCFLPRHGLRIMADRSRVDLVICFQCNSARVYVERDGQEPVEDYYLPGHSAQTALNKMLTDAGVPLPTR